MATEKMSMMSFIPKLSIDSYVLSVFLKNGGSNYWEQLKSIVQVSGILLYGHVYLLGLNCCPHVMHTQNVCALGQ